MRQVPFLCTALAAFSLTTSAFSQTSFPEVEPNSLKSEATPITGMASGDSITGTSTGASATAGSTLSTTADVYRIQTAVLPLAVYKHTLTITAGGPTTYTSYIRGLNQANGVIGTTDIIFQTGATLQNIWYGFGRQEQLHYQINGTATTTAAYTSTLTSTPVTPIAVAGTFNAGLITVTTAGQGHATDTEIYLYDSNFDPVPLGHNDGSAASSTVSTVTVPLCAGTYYIADSVFNTSNNQSDLAPTEGWDDDNLLEFPNAVACNSTSNAANVAFSVSDGTTTTPVAATKTSNFQIIWATFTVVPSVGAPANDNCASASPLGATVGADTSNATNDGAASCDPGGAASRDVWYSFTDPSGSGGTLTLDSCGLSSVDTVVSVHAACGGTELACNDNCGGAPCAGSSSCLSVVLAPNQSVKVRVSDKGLSGGCFVLHRSYVGNPPVNDLCTSAIALAGPGVYGFDTTLATSGQGTTSATCGGAPAKNLWYSYVATTAGTLTVSNCGQVMGTTSLDTEIWIYSGAGCPTAPAIACNDDACGLQTTVTTPVVCGATYMLEVGNYDFQPTANIFGTFTVTETGTTCSTPSTPFCDGSSVGTTCLGCGTNNGSAGRGCGNSSFAGGALLTNTGIASVTADTLVLTCSDMTGPGLFFQANGLITPTTFGDGMLCAGLGIIRMGVVFPTANTASYPGGLTPNPIHIAGGPINGGDIKHYQCWYRDAIVFCTSATFNTSNGITLTWAN